MKESPTIRIFLASLLLGIFLMGIMPRQILHDIFSDHTHLLGTGGEESSISIKGFQCDSQSVVAKSPFVETDLLLPGAGQYLIYGLQVSDSLKSGPGRQVPKQQQLRGPPVFS